MVIKNWFKSKEEKVLVKRGKEYKGVNLKGLCISFKGRDSRGDRSQVKSYSKGELKRNKLTLLTESYSDIIRSKKGIVRLKVELLNV